MAGFIDSAVQDIDNRLKELKEEEARLLAARAALAGTAQARPRPRAPAAPAAKAGDRPPRPRPSARTPWRQHALRAGARARTQQARHHDPGDRVSDEDRAELPVPRDAEADR